jgi:polyphosphate kinase
MPPTPSRAAYPPTSYQIVVRGELSRRYRTVFEGMTLEVGNGQTAITGPVLDQTHLHGLLNRVGDLGLELVSEAATPLLATKLWRTPQELTNATVLKGPEFQASAGSPPGPPRHLERITQDAPTSSVREVRDMAKKNKKDQQPKLKRKPYEKELRRLHGELVAMQEWVKAEGAKVCVVFEGRDTAGKGGTIKRIVERVSPRVFRVVALPTPTEREKSQMYMQRYVPHFPAGGEVVIFDRSWYNRAGVERVMGFCKPEETERFLDLAPSFEKAMVDSGILLVKYWLEVSPEEQTRRLEGRIDDPRKVWKLSGMDLKSYSRWYDYSRARDAMFAATDTAWAPWFVAYTDDKKRGRLNIISHLLGQVPYKPLAHKDVTLPKRQRANGYVEPDLPLHHIPTPF